MRISSLSEEYVRVKVSATESGATVDPTSDPVVMAFTTGSAYPSDIDGDWQTASWETSGTSYYARCLVGPNGTIALPVGAYSVWVRVTDDPEVPVRRVGRLIVT